MNLISIRTMRKMGSNIHSSKLVLALECSHKAFLTISKFLNEFKGSVLNCVLNMRKCYNEQSTTVHS